VRRYQQKIYNLIYRQVRNRETAKDLCQTVFLRAFLALPNFRLDSAFYSWLYQIAQNVCIDYHRRQQARDNIFSAKAVDDTLHIRESHPCPSQLMEQKELRAILRKAVLHLPPMRRRVLTLRYTEELSIKVIAARLGKSEGTIKTHISIAHHQLRELLCPYLKNEPLQWYKKP